MCAGHRDLSPIDDRRSENALIPRIGHNISYPGFLGFIKVRVYLVHAELLHAKRRRFGRVRLRRPGLLSRHIALWDRTLFYRPQRLARYPVKNIEETCFSW